jgi:hypothetical protein
MAWLTTEAVRTRERELVLGESLSDFLRQLGLIPSGGAWGSITRLKEQAKRLFHSVVICSYEEKDKSAWLTYSLSDRGIVWWNPDDFKETKQGQRHISRIMLSVPFFNEITQHPVPIDLRALKALSRSSLAIDIYCWLTYRMSYLRKPVEIPWPALQAQFGADYRRLDNFQAAFREQLRKVVGVYPAARLEEGEHGLVLRPSRTHVATLVDNPVDKESYPRINGREDVSAEPSAKPTATRVSELRAALGKKTTNKR